MAKKDRHSKQVIAVFISGTLLVVTLVAANLKVSTNSQAAASWGKRDVCHQCMSTYSSKDDPEYRCAAGQNLMCMPHTEGGETISRCRCPKGSIYQKCKDLYEGKQVWVDGYKNLPPFYDFIARWIQPNEPCWRPPKSVFP